MFPFSPQQIYLHLKNKMAFSVFYRKNRVMAVLIVMGINEKKMNNVKQVVKYIPVHKKGAFIQTLYCRRI